MARELDVPVSEVRALRILETGGTAGDSSASLQDYEREMVESVQNNPELADWEGIFCLHYCRTFNATAAYLKARPGCRYDSAASLGSLLLKKTAVKREIRRLKKLRNSSLMADAQDVVQKFMQIAFADMKDYARWGTKEVELTEGGKPVLEPDPDNPDGPPVPVKKVVGEMQLLSSAQVDGTLVSEVRQTRDGGMIKLADRMAALKWLADYFELNPGDKRRGEFERWRMELAEQGGDKTLKPPVFEVVPVGPKEEETNPCV